MEIKSQKKILILMYKTDQIADVYLHIPCTEKIYLQYYNGSFDTHLLIHFKFWNFGSYKVLNHHRFGSPLLSSKKSQLYEISQRISYVKILNV